MSLRAGLPGIAILSLLGLVSCLLLGRQAAAEPPATQPPPEEEPPAVPQVSAAPQVPAVPQVPAPLQPVAPALPYLVTQAPVPWPGYPVPPARASRRVRLLAEVEAGFAYQRIYSDHALAGSVELHFGADWPRADVGGRLGLRAGQTLAGLPEVVVSVGPEVGYHAGRWLRVGAGLDLGMMSVGRTTRSDPFISGYFAVHPDLWVDLDHWHRPQGGALFVHLRPLLELFRSDMAPSFAALAALGARF